MWKMGENKIFITECVVNERGLLFFQKSALCITYTTLKTFNGGLAWPPLFGGSLDTVVETSTKGPRYRYLSYLCSLSLFYTQKENAPGLKENGYVKKRPAIAAAIKQRKVQKGKSVSEGEVS